MPNIKSWAAKKLIKPTSDSPRMIAKAITILLECFVILVNIISFRRPSVV